MNLPTESSVSIYTLNIFKKIWFSSYFLFTEVSTRKGGDNGLFITIVSKLLWLRFLIRCLNNIGDLFEFFFLVCSLIWVFKHFNHGLQSTEGVILSIIIGDVHHLSAIAISFRSLSFKTGKERLMPRYEALPCLWWL